VLWQLEWGEQIEFLEDVESRTGETPTALLNRPKRWVWLEEYLQAFDTLSRSRSIGFSRNPISFQDIVTYAQFYDVEDFDSFCLLIQHIDGDYLEYLANRDKNQSSNESTNVNPQSRS